MGTSAAVNYAYLYVGLLEVKRLLPNYKNNLLFYKRFIDDGIDVWIEIRANHSRGPASFEPLITGGLYDDLNISIDENQKLFFKSYQKPMNLYLYTPPTSTHPAKMLHSLIYGRLAPTSYITPIPRTF